jgi:hypothetical protein
MDSDALKESIVFGVHISQRYSTSWAPLTPSSCGFLTDYQFVATRRNRRKGDRFESPDDAYQFVPYLHVGHLPKGMYFLSLRAHGQVWSGRFVKG